MRAISIGIGFVLICLGCAGAQYRFANVELDSARYEELGYAEASATGVMILNVIPAYPLDGGRMFQAALWPKLGFHKAMTWAVYTSFVCAGLLLLYAVISQDIILGLIAIWVGQGAALERRRLRYGLYDDLVGPTWGGGEFDVQEPEPSAFAKWKGRRAERRAEDDRRRKRELRERLDEVLATVSEVGLDGLSKDERTFLDQASQELRKEQSGTSP